MIQLFANSGDPDQMPGSAASDLSLHCLPNTLLGVHYNGLTKYRFLFYFFFQLNNRFLSITSANIADPDQTPQIV